ncbi:MAG: DUF4258 domain-containing protein [Nanoarchaeota archaeon]|nr:DUF4258 domain-containing protein [Nanoarchaeota archaeon]MBU1004471.1 DUF4258 domain-containing protein [Nanoarchaeota archaeon]MBU1945558.1 DUF4258 domain-containing protein [Nanoarchaeota archaeon]
MGILFKVNSCLNKDITITRKRWELITDIKHPIMKNKESDVKEAINNPDEVKVSKTDQNVFLYYRKKEPYITCAVVRHENGGGFLITSYLTDKIKEGRTIFKK